MLLEVNDADLSALAQIKPKIAMYLNAVALGYRGRSERNELSENAFFKKGSITSRKTLGLPSWKTNTIFLAPIP